MQACICSLEIGRDDKLPDLVTGYHSDAARNYAAVPVLRDTAGPQMAGKALEAIVIVEDFLCIDLSHHQGHPRVHLRTQRAETCQGKAAVRHQVNMDQMESLLEE